MKNAFRVFWEAVKDFREEFYVLAPMNLLTALLAVPVVTFPPALAGLWSAANKVAGGKPADWEDYFKGFRRYFWKTWKLALLNFLVIIILASNIWFYSSSSIKLFKVSRTLNRVLQALFKVVLALWLVYQMYPFAMLLEQREEHQGWRIALHNAAALYFGNPVFAVVLALLSLIVAVISTFVPILWILITLAFFALLYNKAVKYLLEPYREQRAEAKGEEGVSAEDDRMS